MKQEALVREVHLRAATREDVAAMHRVRLSVRENRLSVPSRVTEADYLPYLRHPQACWVAEIEGRLVGFAIADIQGRNIWALFVNPDYEGRGVGRALLDCVTTRLLASGSGPIHLVTAPDTRAERLYMAAGWVKVGVKPSGEVRLERSGHGAGDKSP